MKLTLLPFHCSTFSPLTLITLPVPSRPAGHGKGTLKIPEIINLSDGLMADPSTWIRICPASSSGTGQSSSLGVVPYYLRIRAFCVAMLLSYFIFDRKVKNHLQ